MAKIILDYQKPKFQLHVECSELELQTTINTIRDVLGINFKTRNFPSTPGEINAVDRAIAKWDTQTTFNPSWPGPDLSED